MVTTFGRAGIDENNTLKKQTDTRNADVGFIKPFARNTVPDGYLYCDGSAVSRTTYSELFAAIGTIYGAGDGSTTFNVPDLRGYFLRGDGGTNSAAMGTAQGDAIRNITGRIAFRPAVFPNSTDTLTDFVATMGGGAIYADPITSESTNTPLLIAASTANGEQQTHFDASRVVPTAADNRPSNFSMKYCIGY